MLENIFILTVSFFVSTIFLYLFSKYLSRYLIDKPNNRSNHTKIISRGGGISFVLITIIGSLFFFLYDGFSNKSFLSFLCIPIAIIGLLDDLFGLQSFHRLIFQILSAILILKFSPVVSLQQNFINYLIIIFLVTFLVSITNFINFMDGIDGLVGSTMLVIFITAFLLTGETKELLLIIGSLAGFLSWNLEPAKVFMGDVGSTFLGLFFAGIIVNSESFQHAIGLFLIATPLIMDAFICVLRRKFAGQNPFSAHKLHLYQRLVAAGWSHSKVTFIYTFATIIGSVAYLLMGLKLIIIVSLLQIVFGIYLDQNKAIPFNLNIVRN